jgi:hypothetical protein
VSSDEIFLAQDHIDPSTIVPQSHDLKKLRTMRSASGSEAINLGDSYRWVLSLVDFEVLKMRKKGELASELRFSKKKNDDDSSNC